MFNWVLAVLVTKKVITEDEAKFLSKELAQSIAPTHFGDALSQVERLFETYKRNS